MAVEADESHCAGNLKSLHPVFWCYVDEYVSGEQRSECGVVFAFAPGAWIVQRQEVFQGTPFQFFSDVFFVPRSGVKREPQMLHRMRTVTTGTVWRASVNGPEAHAG